MLRTPGENSQSVQAEFFGEKETPWTAKNLSITIWREAHSIRYENLFRD